ncbi:MAG: electron transfer flavoprotein [Candidatus Meridianibacter frigidus]|nr:MAG: electron transfer flavoprotein [Candidatus Eremiobacteraeota bacterium]
MAQRDSLEVDVLFVGAGPASLAGAIRLCQLAKENNRELSVMVIEKGAEIGSHGISGAVMDPRALDELLPAWRQSAPIESEVTRDALWFLTAGAKIAAPIVPPMMNNGGKYVASLQKIAKWLGEQAEDAGADLFPSFPGQELLWDGDCVIGVRIGDKGLDKNGNPKSNYEPGADLFAKITVLGEGPRGTLAKQAVAKLALDAGAEPQVYAAGVKEIWQCAPGSVRAGSVIHTLGFPLDRQTFGGGFIYGMAADILDVGFVTGLDYRNPTTDPHNEFGRFKAHPAVAKMLEGAKLLRYGAKAIPEGGLFAMPRLYASGLLLAGDSAGFLNGMRLKGIHLAMKSGMLAAETAFEALAADSFASDVLASYESKFKNSWAHTELRSARNFHQGFERGMFAGLLNTGIGMITGGRGFGVKDRLHGQAGFQRMQKAGFNPARTPRAAVDNVIVFDKLTDVYNSGTMHEEDQPCHLKIADLNICRDRCSAEYGNPCRHFCPAQVYEPMFTQSNGGFEGRLQINFTNCVHCKTCDIADPYQIITWVPPQGGEGPVYTGL